MYPQDYRYSKGHEWARIDGEIAVVGLTDFAQEILGDVKIITLPDVGQHVDLGGGIGSVESLKVSGEIHAPLSGIVVEVNQAVVDNPDLFNNDPHGAGWLLKIRFGAASEFDALMNAEQYERYADACDI